MVPTNAPADDAPAVDQHTAAANGASHGSKASAFSNASVAEQLVSLVSNTVGARGSLLLVLLSQTGPHDTRMQLQCGPVTAGCALAAVCSLFAALGPTSLTHAADFLQIINEAAFANNCGIPPAALIHTLPANLPEVPQVRRAPARCLKCNGFVNTYTTVDFSSKTWSCNFCGRKHSTKSDMPVEQLAVSST
jgi:hypothetical protein